MALDLASATLWNSIFISVTGFVLAVLWGVWDRRRQARKEANESSLGERQLLSKSMQEHIANLERDRDYNEKQAHDARAEREACHFDRDNVWEAFRKYSGIAHEIRHECIAVIYTLSIRLGEAGKHQVTPLPNIQDIYHETKRRKEVRNARLD